MSQLTLSQTIENVQALIDSGNGDSGRLYYILECLKNNRHLYRSDQNYLEKKLESPINLEEKSESSAESYFLPKIQELINSGIGDPGRLQHIFDMISNNKTLYHSDAAYLESKLNEPIPQQQVETKIISEPKKPEFVSTPPPKPESEPKINRGTMPKGWNATPDYTEVEKISNDIRKEEEKINKQKLISNEIDAHRSKLTQLMSHRKEYEQKVTQEKATLEAQIQEERLKIETQTKLSEEIIAQKEELAKVKKERTKIIKNINSEKTKITKELSQQKRQLVQAQLEQEKIEKQVETEQILLAKMIEEQKSRLLEQASIANEIKSKQNELENAKKDYEIIVSQVNAEKAKFAESEKLKNLIKSKEADLIKAKEERLNLINTISEEKELITKKAKEEKERLKSQEKLAKQLKQEEKAYESLKKKREKTEQQIKLKNQKLKEKQQKLKQQISAKDKKLKSLNEKISTKTTKKPTSKTVKRTKKKSS
ncbi:hypothetical protein Nisw_01015 [Candidatus Nitrosopumilus sp. SW]|uniref:hypothetical protein n=1 Tax=Candidatus Nitrosopumilus sp. SW TaxID=2508726 RepID=UPI0011549765|nr:hypothetical protein [Candidatus Nitrosopumilus sp. SW]QDI88210.1 hypothetical protein Nisw_01015 [Candidatus Nitrosopumilus sp. SW]